MRDDPLHSVVSANDWRKVWAPLSATCTDARSVVDRRYCYEGHTSFDRRDAARDADGQATGRRR